MREVLVEAPLSCYGKGVGKGEGGAESESRSCGLGVSPAFIIIRISKSPTLHVL